MNIRTPAALAATLVLACAASPTIAQDADTTAAPVSTVDTDEGFDMGWIGLLGLAGLLGLRRKHDDTVQHGSAATAR